MESNETVKKVIDWYKCTGKGFARGKAFKGRYRAYKGARNTKKSFVAIVYDCIRALFENENNNAVIIREIMSSHRTTTFATFKRIINRPVEDDPSITLAPFFKINNTNMTITRRKTKQVIYFLGMDDPQKIQGIQVEKGYLTRVYVDEAFQIKNYADWDIVDGSIRGKLPEYLYHQITFCFNAWNKKHWLYERFFKGRLEDDYFALENSEKGYLEYINETEPFQFGIGVYLHISTYRINEFRDTKNYDMAMERLKIVAPDLYKVNALGMWGNATGSTYPHFKQDLVISYNDSIRKYMYDSVVIGIDTGLSNSQGRIIYDQEMRYKSATTMVLKGLTYDCKKIIALNEYFISNQGREVPYTEPQVVEMFAKKIKEWVALYAQVPRVLKGNKMIYVDCADIGFRQSLALELQKQGLFDCYTLGSTKKGIEIRVQFTNLMMAYGDYLICETCPNLIREIGNSQKGIDGEPREDFDDHTINASEYGDVVFYNKISAWKMIKKDI